MRNHGIVWVWLSIVIILLDQIVKFAVITHLLPYQEVKILPFFSLLLAFNTGAAFSLLSTASGWQLWFFSGVAIFVCLFILWWLAHLSAQHRFLCIALACILGGAIGNLVDRLTLGYVVDYILLHVGQYRWPAFNVADSAISIGAVMLVLDVFLHRRK